MIILREPSFEALLGTSRNVFTVTAADDLISFATAPDLTDGVTPMAVMLRHAPVCAHGAHRECFVHFKRIFGNYHLRSFPDELPE